MPRLADLPSPLYTDRSNVPYWEDHLGYQEVWEQDNAMFIRRLGCLWRDRVDFTDDLLSFTEYTSGNILGRDLPQADPEMDSFYCLGGIRSVKKDGRPSRHVTHEMLYMVDDTATDPSTDAKDPRDNNTAFCDGMIWYDVPFMQPMFTIKSDAEAGADADLEASRWVIEEKDFSCDMLPLPNRFLEFETAGPNGNHPPLGEAAPIPFPKGVKAFTWLEVPEIAWPEDTVFDMIGAVNANTFKGRPPETLLFLGPKVRRYRAASAHVYLAVTYVFEYRKTTHNKFMNLALPTTATDWPFDYARRVKQPDERTYDKRNFLDLFNPALP